MMKYLILPLLLHVSFASAKPCSPQSIEILKNDKSAVYIDCYTVNDKPETMVAVQIFRNENLGRIGLTLSAYEYAFKFGPKSTPTKFKTQMAQDLLPFMYNDKLVYGSLYADVDLDGQKEIVLNGYVMPKVLQFYIVGWDQKNQSFVFESRSTIGDQSVNYFAGANIPSTDFEYPRLDTRKKILLIPSENHLEEKKREFYKSYKLIGPLYVEDVK